MSTKKLTREDLEQQLLFWQPEIPFIKYGEKELLMVVDAFNNHIYWDIKWYEDGKYYYKEFDNSMEAFDELLKEEL